MLCKKNSAIFWVLFKCQINLFLGTFTSSSLRRKVKSGKKWEWNAYQNQTINAKKFYFGFQNELIFSHLNSSRRNFNEPTERQEKFYFIQQRTFLRVQVVFLKKYVWSQKNVIDSLLKVYCRETIRKIFVKILHVMSSNLYKTGEAK